MKTLYIKPPLTTLLQRGEFYIVPTLRVGMPPRKLCVRLFI